MLRKITLPMLIVALAASLAWSQGQRPASGGNTQTTLVAGLPPGVGAPGIGIVGTPGVATACYWIVTNYVGGAVMGSAGGCSSRVPNTLNSSNYVQLTWGVPGAGVVSYDVLKVVNGVVGGPSPTPGATVSITTGLTVTNYQDQGGSLSAYTAAAFTYSNVTAVIRLNNRDYVLPQVEVTGFPLTLTPQGGQGETISVNILTDNNGNKWLVPVPAAGAVDWMTLSNAAAGGTINLLAAGSDSNIPINISAKGTGNVAFGTSTVGFDRTGALLTAEYATAQSVTLAQVNAGFTLVAAVTNRTLTVDHVLIQPVGGSTAGCTDVRISDTAGSPVDALTATVAGLTSGTVNTEATATTVTLGIFGAPLTASQGLQIRKTGSACTTTVSFLVIVQYTIDS